MPYYRDERMIDECKGCRIIRRFSRCFFRDVGLVEKCPCVQCLVKVMCKDKCENRKDYYNSFLCSSL